MEQDTFALMSLFLFSMLVFWLIGQNIAWKAKIIPKIKCFFGIHIYSIMVDGRSIKKYICQNCKRSRKFPHLRIIDGGNKLPCKVRKI